MAAINDVDFHDGGARWHQFGKLPRSDCSMDSKNPQHPHSVNARAVARERFQWQGRWQSGRTRSRPVVRNVGQVRWQPIERRLVEQRADVDP
jgi:hypothetical protein